MSLPFSLVITDDTSSAVLLKYEQPNTDEKNYRLTQQHIQAMHDAAMDKFKTLQAQNSGGTQRLERMDTNGDGSGSSSSSGDDLGEETLTEEPARTQRRTETGDL